MKKINLILVLLIVLLIGAFITLSSGKNEKLYGPVETPFITDIINKKVISGNLYPGQEIELKSPISGVLETTYVKIGDKVSVGDKIAKVQLVPDPAQLEAARKNFNMAKISFAIEKTNYNREKKLYEDKVIAKANFDKSRETFELSREQYLSAKNQLTLIEKGFIADSEISNVVKATAAGVIFDLPIAAGEQVIERNNFTEGATLAVIANLSHYKFIGKVVEADIQALHKIRELNIIIPAIDHLKTTASLHKISPRGQELYGTMKYEVVAILHLPADSVWIGSGFSAIGEIVIEERKDVIAIKEKHLLFDGDSAYVQTLNNHGAEVKKFVKTGLSDGVDIEIVEGLDLNDRIITHRTGT